MGKIIAFLCVFLSGLFLYLDTQFPQGFAVGTTYVAIVVISFLISNSIIIIFFAILCTLLVITGFYFSPESGLYEYAIYNRLVSIIVIWITALIGLMYRRSKEELEKNSSALEKEIIERKTADEYSKAIVDYASDAIITIDTHGLILSFNYAAENLFGYRENEVLGNNVSLLMPSPYREEHDSYLEHYLRTGEKKIIGIGREVTGIHKDGREIQIELTVAEVKVGDRHIFVGDIRDITERKRTQEELAYLAHYDNLTGLPNRALFRERLEQTLVRSKRNKSLFALMFIDLDGFKQVNDTLGHDVGDLLLIEVAGKFKNCLRESDTIARMGGDEFTVMLEEITNKDDPSIVAQKLIESLGPEIEINGRLIDISTSIGITLYPGDASSENNLLKNADIAMYKAKEQGRNQYQYFKAAMIPGA